jgi:hypothetical protein
LKCLLILTLSPRFLAATGYEEPARWLDHAEHPPALTAPEFYFELEVKRLAAELHPEFRAVLPPKDDNESRDYRGQTIASDKADFVAALDQKKITPPDRDKAIAAHERAREKINNLEPVAAEVKPAALPDFVSEEFASEFVDYHRGAWAFRRHFGAEAVEAWQALLARPVAERHFRTTWAAYMIGVVALDEKRWDDARAAFQLVRQSARAGFADSPGLATASLGWEAQIEQDAGNFPRAAQLFLEQLAAGDLSGVWSLRYLLDAVFEQKTELATLAKDPVMQRLVTASNAALIGPFADYDSDEKHRDGWLEALESFGAKDVRDADRVGWIAYSHGRYDDAARWLRRADGGGAYAQWLQAKLALRDGKIEVATALLSKALAQLPLTVQIETRSLNGDELMPLDTARADLGALQLARGDFLTALRFFVDGGHMGDADYLAEGVLTIAELKKFVDALPPKRAGNDAASEPDYARDGLRHILASRLIRAERHAEARPYLPEERQRETLDKFTALLAQGRKRGVSKAGQAAAYEAAALLIRKDGGDLFEISEVQMQAARLSGRQVTKDEYPQMTYRFGEKAEFGPAVTKTERERLKQNTHKPLKHELYLYVAADLAWRAAALMSDQDERTAHLLNTAGCWLKAMDDGAADRFYQAIERRCAKTEIGKEAIKKHWFVNLPDEEETKN